MSLKSVAPKAEHIAFRNALIETCRKHGADLQADELLAIASHLVGQLVALQDQRTMTVEMAMDIVVQNVQRGNADAVDPLMFNTGGHA